MICQECLPEILKRLEACKSRFPSDCEDNMYNLIEELEQEASVVHNGPVTST